MTFVVLDAFSWRDVGRSGDAFDLLVLLRGHDPQESPESAVREFLQLAGLFPLVENVANSVDVEEPVPVNHNGTSPTKSRRKQPADLLVLIPGNAPISQTELFETARARGINRWYARDLINDLLAMEQIFIWKLPRPNAKSAIGYARVPQR
jgi:hypothetical protein